jgi:hypothetical protein
MERKDLPVWLERVVERKENQAQELAAHVADVPDAAQARRVRFGGATADLDQTLDRQREIRAAATTPGPTRDPSTSG